MVMVKIKSSNSIYIKLLSLIWVFLLITSGCTGSNNNQPTHQNTEEKINDAKISSQSQIYDTIETEPELKITEGQYFDESDPRGIGVFTKEEIESGFDKSNLSCKVIAIRDRSIYQKDNSYKIAPENQKPITAEDIAIVVEYIEKFSPESILTDYIIEPDFAIVQEYISKYAPESTISDYVYSTDT